MSREWQDKPLKEWTFDELVTRMAWHAMVSLLHGTTLRTIVHNICDHAARWNAEQKK